MTNGEAKTKGASFTNVRAFVCDRFEPSGWPAVLARLRVEDRRAVDEILPVGWYSLALYARLVRAVDELHGCGDRAALVQLGRFSAERDLPAIRRSFRVGSPLASEAAVVRLGDYWRRLHDTGTWSLQGAESSRVSGTLDGWGHVDHALCRELGGYIGRALELVGAHGVVVEHPHCRAHGDPTCAFQARWAAVALPARRARDDHEESGARPIVRALDDDDSDAMSEDAVTARREHRWPATLRSAVGRR